MATTKQIIELDCREPANQSKIQKVLRQIKPLAKCPEGQDIPVEKLERVISVLSNKYQIAIVRLVPDPYVSDGLIWRVEIGDAKTFKELGKVFGATTYEALAKATIVMYSEARKRKQV